MKLYEILEKHKINWKKFSVVSLFCKFWDNLDFLKDIQMIVKLFSDIFNGQKAAKSVRAIYNHDPCKE